MATVQPTASDEGAQHTKPAFLRRVRIRNYKSIGYCDVPLMPLTILVGRNAAGKSNFLDALAFLRDTMTFGVTEAVKNRGGWKAVVSQCTPASALELEIEASFRCGPTRSQPQIDDVTSASDGADGVKFTSLEDHEFTATYSLTVVGRDDFPPAIQEEKCNLHDLTEDKKGYFFFRPHLDPPRIPRAKNGAISHSTKTELGASYEVSGSAAIFGVSEPWRAISREVIKTLPDRVDKCLLSILGSQPFVELADGLRSMGFYNLHPDAIRTLQKPLSYSRLEKDGRNVASVLATLKTLEPELFLRVRDYLRTIAGEVDAFEITHYGDYETVRFKLRGANELEFDAGSMSDGTLRALATLVAAFQVVVPNDPVVIGIEEPEAALHPAAVRTLVDALDEATQHSQILLTTHSAELLDGREICPGQVLVVRNRNRQTYITPVDPASMEIIRKELYTLADLQRMDKLDVDEAYLKEHAPKDHEGGA